MVIKILEKKQKELREMNDYMMKTHKSNELEMIALQEAINELTAMGSK